MNADNAATFFVEWVYANPGLPPEEYAVKCSEFIAEAVLAEREACAMLAEFRTPEEDWHPHSVCCNCAAGIITGLAGKKIAALIRGRGDAKP